ncbi:oligosaccharide flippase family protein [Mesorhizobium sp. ES1-1]|uniref:oligosaccharide flippase family protein n=1 Tax=Mesorhizobium sp. ES1-1 TaxID=2876629 RepID=UPI001CCA968D|nr:oligosaccharide flippase family protein [Mesorhizobium sp. ES1-1]MBZ9674724.1 oligosaccharide flippase family protein [Mesorhizobium sp. ES1-1]
MPIPARLKALLGGGFVRSVALLAGGTAFAQGLMVLALPFLTRLYTPHDFGILAVYAGLLAIISGAACLRFDIAIPLPESDEDAINVLAVALLSGAVVSLGITVSVVFFPNLIARWLRQPELASYLWMLPIGVLAASSYSALQFWTMREKAFAAIARTRMSQAIGAITAQASLGWLGFAPFGLLLGQMISGGAGVVGLAARGFSKNRDMVQLIRPGKMRAMFRDYNRFPKFSALETLANTAGIQVPIILVAALSKGHEAGYLMLAMRVMQTPMGLIGGAISQVYLSEASEEQRAGRLGTFTTTVLAGLVRTGVGPLLFAGIVAPQVFGVVFGTEWQNAGELVSWMTPWFIMQFLASPISMVMHVANKQPQMLILTLFGLILRVGLVILAYILEPNYIAEFYAVSGFVYYTICLIIFYISSGATSGDFKFTRLGIIHLGAWIVAALLVVEAMQGKML